jgi:hypothetical protein
MASLFVMPPPKARSGGKRLFTPPKKRASQVLEPL